MTSLLKNNPGAQSVYLKVAEGGVYPRATVVQTVLGSCLGGVFHSPAKGVGAIFHAFLPRRADYEPQGAPPVFKYVDTAIEHVVRQFTRLGVSAGSLRVSLVGGANGMVDEQNGVGLKNVDAALEVLDRLRVRPVFTDVGGERGRKVYFLSSTGELQIFMLSGMEAQLAGGKPRKPCGRQAARDGWKR